MIVKLFVGAMLLFQAVVAPFPGTVKVIPLTSDETALISNSTTQDEVNKIVGYLQIKYLLDNNAWVYKKGWENGFTVSDDYKYIVSNQSDVNLANPIPAPIPAVTPAPKSAPLTN